MCHLISKCLKSFLFSDATDVKFNLTVVEECSVYDFDYFKFVAACFMAQGMVYLGLYSGDNLLLLLFV